MKVRASVKKICKNCKVVRRQGVVRILCLQPASQATPGLNQDSQDRQDMKDGEDRE